MGEVLRNARLKSSCSYVENCSLQAVAFYKTCSMYPLDESYLQGASDRMIHSSANGGRREVDPRYERLERMWSLDSYRSIAILPQVPLWTILVTHQCN